MPIGKNLKIKEPCEKKGKINYRSQAISVPDHAMLPVPALAVCLSPVSAPYDRANGIQPSLGPVRELMGVSGPYVPPNDAVVGFPRLDNPVHIAPNKETPASNCQPAAVVRA